LRFRITRPRAITLGAMVAIAGVSIPATLSAAPGTEPTTLSAAQFAPVVVAGTPAADAPASRPAFAPAVPSSDVQASVAAVARTHARPTPPRARAAAAATTVVKPLPKPKPKPKAQPASRSTARATSRVTFSSSSSSARTRVVQIALAQLHDRYVAGGVGPSSFDCSGLVRYAYNQAGVGSRLGGGHSASAMLAWGRSNGLTSRSNGRPGDVVVYGNGSHVGIYIGHGKIVSALNPSQGIQVTGIYALGASFTTFIHTHI
jgi:cell wall-associated NlpC family hydrolase